MEKAYAWVRAWVRACGSTTPLYFEECRLPAVESDVHMRVCVCVCMCMCMCVCMCVRVCVYACE